VETLTLYISGMVCGGCSGTVQKTLLALQGVTRADVSHVEGTAEVAYDPARVQPAQIKATIEATGYSVR
jgi:copper chaperone CopZ